MIVTAIAKEGWGDKFNSGDEIKGEATRYSQSHIWMNYELDLTGGVSKKTTLLVQTKVKIVKGTIKKVNHAKTEK